MLGVNATKHNDAWRGKGGEGGGFVGTHRVVILVYARHGLEHLHCVLVEHVHPEPS